jgi:hypothetical protein
MFEKTLDGLSADARAAVELAREEADRFGHTYVGTEHLLLGLLRQDEPGARVLAEQGAGLERVRHAVGAIIGRGERPHVGETQLTPRAWHVVDLARVESRWRGHDAVGPEHLLLGLIREGEGIAWGVLESLGVRPIGLRGALQRADPRFLQGPRPGVGPGPPAPWVQGSSSVATSRATDQAAPPPGADPRLRDLRRVLPLAQTEIVGGTAVTATALELYANGFLCYVWVVPARAAPVTPADVRHPELPFEARDDRGGRYAPRLGGASRDGHEWRASFVFTPAPDPAAARLELTLPEIRWRRFQSGQTVPTADEPEAGPWTFAVELTPER